MRLIYNILTGIILSMFLLFISQTAVTAQNSDRETFSNLDKSMSLYPVPASNFLHVKLSGSFRTDADKVEMYSVIGRKVAEQDVKKTDSEITFNNLNNYPSGVYMVIAKDHYGKIIASSKIVINH